MKPKFMMKQKLKNDALWCKIAKNLVKCFIYEARINLWCVFWTLFKPCLVSPGLVTQQAGGQEGSSASQTTEQLTRAVCMLCSVSSHKNTSFKLIFNILKYIYLLPSCNVDSKTSKSTKATKARILWVSCLTKGLFAYLTYLISLTYLAFSNTFQKDENLAIVQKTLIFDKTY